MAADFATDGLFTKEKLLELAATAESDAAKARAQGMEDAAKGFDAVAAKWRAAAAERDGSTQASQSTGANQSTFFSGNFSEFKKNVQGGLPGQPAPQPPGIPQAPTAPASPDFGGFNPADMLPINAGLNVFGKALDLASRFAPPPKQQAFRAYVRPPPYAPRRPLGVRPKPQPSAQPKAPEPAPEAAPKPPACEPAPSVWARLRALF